MMSSTHKRWLYLAVGTIATLFAGILYGWSILKAPFAAEFHWSSSQLALNFTIAMCCFCIGGVAGGLLAKKSGTRLPLILAAVLASMGFMLTARLNGGSVVALYGTYGVLAALGIGLAYNVILSCVGAWFPDKKGLCSGLLMMGFGSSALVLGQLCDYMIQSPSLGWRFAFSLLGVSLGVVFLLCALILRVPEQTPAAKQAVESSCDCPPGAMVRSLTFWQAFFCIVFLCAVGNSTISFAKDLALSVGAEAGLATTLVGALSICNGLGRIFTGVLFDSLGCRKTMLFANLAAMAAALTTLGAVSFSSVPLCVVGLCMIGISYGTCPTISSAFISDFYGSKYFSVNFSIMTFNMMGASLIASGANLLAASSGGYTIPFAMLSLLTVLALALNVRIFHK